jgi:hypothetical protein
MQRHSRRWCGAVPTWIAVQAAYAAPSLRHPSGWRILILIVAGFRVLTQIVAL